MTITSNIQKIKAEIPENVRLIAVTKRVSVESIRQAYAEGVRDFAENHLQEALEKQEQLQDLSDICWHFIGHLQTNKTQKVFQNFHWIHSVDSIKLAQRLDQLGETVINLPQLCLQVKPLSDPNKYGWHINELLQTLPQLEQLKRLRIKGLMTILPLGLSGEETLQAFLEIKKLQTKINHQSSLQLTELSMGMSEDYPRAIEAGSTMIRLGRILFGERNIIQYPGGG